MNFVFDIGGTKTRIGLVNDVFKLLETTFFLTDKKYASGMKKIIEFVKNKDVKVDSICAGLPGVLKKEGGLLYSAPNLKNWIGKPVKKDLENEFKSEVYLENDAALAGLGEAVYGAGKDYKIVTYLTVGTGIGGARIVNKYIDEKVYGFEPGHHIMALNEDSEPGSFERLASGKSIKKLYGEAAENITSENTWEKVINNIAVGVANSVYFWSPEIIVLGGGVSHSENFNITLLNKEVYKILKTTYPSVPEIKKSVLGDFSGIWGGIAYLRTIE